jgi:hypothetical protein
MVMGRGITLEEQVRAACEALGEYTYLDVMEELEERRHRPSRSRVKRLPSDNDVIHIIGHSPWSVKVTTIKRQKEGRTSRRRSMRTCILYHYVQDGSSRGSG